jgi:hypothetical protein
LSNVKTFFLIVFAALFALSSCNLPTYQGIKESTSTVLMVSVSELTEYRTGPGQAYNLGGVLNPGQQVEAVGRSPDSDYLLIRDPANPAILWWLKSEHATLTGDPVALPISTPPLPPTPVAAPGFVGGCPTPVGGGPTPVSCPTLVGFPPLVGGCPTPVGGGPTPVSCSGQGGIPPSAGGCPTPVGGGPTPISCPTQVGFPTLVGGCPTPVGGGPTPVSCSGQGVVPPSAGGCPTPVGGGPTPVSCLAPVRHPTKVRGPTPLPTPVK